MKNFTDYFKMDWNLYNLIMDNVITEIRKSGKKYDCIGTFLRGGYIPAVHIANHLNIDHIFNLREYLISEVKEWKNLLVVDDISDTGETLLQYKDFDIACICYKSETKVKPTFNCLCTMNTTWVIFPWEPFSRDMKDKFKSGFEVKL